MVLPEFGELIWAIGLDVLMVGKVDMGEAKRRGDYVSRRAEAVADGRVKRRRVSAKSMEEEIMKSTFPLVMSHLFFRFNKKINKSYAP